MNFHRKDLTDEQLLAIYKKLLFPRMVEERMLLLLRQGKISKWFSGIGQEAIAVGAALALEPDEWIMPLHRNLGIFTTRNMPLGKLFQQWQGSKDGYSKGRERSFHFGSREHHICGMISHLGPQLAIADGVALANKLRAEKGNIQKITLAFTGDGGTSEGDFHEALNLAAVWDLPVIILIENNGYALSTPVSEQYRCTSLVDKAIGYGMEGVQIDGNNVLEVLDTVKGVREYCMRYQKPYLIECRTFRMRGHEEASGIKYVPSHLLEAWQVKDPVSNYENFLRAEGILREEVAVSIRKECRESIEEELRDAFVPEFVIADNAGELRDVYALGSGDRIIDKIDNSTPELFEAVAGAAIRESGERESGEKKLKEREPENLTIGESGLEENESAERGLLEKKLKERKPEIRFIDAVREGLFQSMSLHDNLILMGQDIAEYGGVFKITEGFVEAFGKTRVRNTPLCESAVVGCAMGLSLEGFSSVMEMQFADFVTMGFNQIVNNLAKIHYRWGQPANVVIRMPTGGGVGGGPFHSQSTEAWFAHIPGLKIVYPSTPMDAKGLLTQAINDPNPVLFFEHKLLYRSISGPVPDALYGIEIGKVRIVQKGTDITIITYGLGVHWAVKYAAQHLYISFHIIDLRTLLPLDYEGIRASVAATGKVMVLHEDTLTGGIGAEVSAWISEHCFEWLDAPPMRCASLDTPVPFNKQLEDNFMAEARIDEVVKKLMAY